MPLLPKVPGSLVLVRRPAFGSRMIGFGQRLRFPKEYAYWTHCGIMVSETEMVEALGRGVEKNHFSKYRLAGTSIPTALVPIECDDEARARVVRFALHAVGQRYSFTEIATQGLYLATGQKWRVTRNNQLICSALAAEALSRTDAIFPEEPLWNTPAHLAQYYDIKGPV